MQALRVASGWGALGLALAVPVGLAVASPLMAWRDPVYILGGLAGVAGMAFLLLQPLAARGWLPGLSLRSARRLHRWLGGFLIGAVVLHVAGLWLTSPPDVIDALLFASPTPFAVWGVLAMWAVFLTGLLALFRRRLRPRIWARVHGTLAAIVVIGTVVHALLITGTMEPVSKAALATLILAASAAALLRPAGRA